MVLWSRKWQPIQYCCLEKSMEEECGRLQSIVLQRAGHGLAIEQKQIILLEIFHCKFVKENSI